MCMEALANRMEWLGLTHKAYHRQMLQRIAGPSTPEEFAALTMLASVVEPVKDYTREETATARPAPVPVPPAGQPLNLNKRGQVLRMRRRGENPETIAAALSIPQNEVDLLLKVHQMSLEQVEKGSTQAAG